jgi:hypothetical protein
VTTNGELAPHPDLDNVANVRRDDTVQDTVLNARCILVADLEDLDTESALGVSVVLEQRKAIVLAVDAAALYRALGVKFAMGVSITAIVVQ